MHYVRYYLIEYLANMRHLPVMTCRICDIMYFALSDGVASSSWYRKARPRAFWAVPSSILPRFSRPFCPRKPTITQSPSSTPSLLVSTNKPSIFYCAFTVTLNSAAALQDSRNLSKSHNKTNEEHSESLTQWG